MMLILTRKLGEAINIGGTVQVIVIEIKGNSVRIGVDAPKTLPIYRSEIYNMIQEQNRQAAYPDMTPAELMGYFIKREERET